MLTGRNQINPVRRDTCPPSTLPLGPLPEPPTTHSAVPLWWGAMRRLPNFPRQETKPLHSTRAGSQDEASGGWGLRISEGHWTIRRALVIQMTTNAFWLSCGVIPDATAKKLASRSAGGELFDLWSYWEHRLRSGGKCTQSSAVGTLGFTDDGFAAYVLDDKADLAPLRQAPWVSTSSGFK
ncbi:hypothetical protein BGZ63DRAFT_381162 [Mariannaea sp. PMI_226]|nr:hypothetical protein BGZ63DRAFT_381162 [Mariannaea sp. PMI_226]